jgi:hypothetical protein
MRLLPKTKKGQALVEFALAATLIFFLLAAAVDLGLMFFAVQGLHNAAQEGGTYGSRWLTGLGYGQRVLNENEIRDRVRHESGSSGGIGFVNLLDLNNDGTPDVKPDSNIANCGQGGVVCQVNPATGNLVINDYIQVTMIDDANANGDPTDDGVAPSFTTCTNSSSPTCFIRVSVAFDYRLLFPLAPSFISRQRQLRSSFVMRLRDSFAQNNPAGPAPVFQTATPPPTATPTATPTVTPTPTKTPTPTATPCMRTVPNLVGLSTNNSPTASSAWAAAGFTGSVIKHENNNWTVVSQSLPVGSSQPCSSSITVHNHL